MEVHFVPDMTMAILTFYAKGSYTFIETKENVKYSTRASLIFMWNVRLVMERDLIRKHSL